MRGKERRRVFLCQLFISSCVLLAYFPAVRADVWRCVRPDGTEVYSDRSLGGQCRKLENLPQLIPAPSIPADEAQPEFKKPAVKEPERRPLPGGGRPNDPPADDMIMIREIKAIPNYNSTLGIARYQADMRLLNGDSDWTAERICVEVRFRDPAKTFIDVQQGSCLNDLKPLDERPLTVIYTGMIPPRLSPIEAEVQVLSVKWVK